MPRLSKIGAAALAAFGWTGLNSVSASYLVVAGGGGGGAGGAGSGGGGAGGLLSGTTPLSTTTTYTVTVGAGAVGRTGSGYSSTIPSGSNSVFNSITAIGGGGGSSGNNIGGAGGSGGGGNGGYGTGGGAGTSGQGNAGGTGVGGGYIPPNETYAGGGGGGASAVGANGQANTTTLTEIGGNGGAGTASSITGTSVTYAGGGGGSCYGGNATSKTGGSGGAGGGGTGGTGDSVNGTSGTANLGGGGGAGGGTNSTSGGNGGSGVVIISYPSPQKFGGGIVTTSGSNTIHTFQTSGTLSPLSTLSTSALIVAGGGGGGSYAGGGGGGAGGMQTPTGITIDTNSIYVVTVGAGGTGGTNSSPTATSGANSIFSAYATASVGGGSGGGYYGSFVAGATGGSGGGAPYAGASFGSGTSGQGNAGASGTGGSLANNGGGGGGGAGAVGGAPNLVSGSPAGAGGVGLTSSISGTSTYYAGGGGGGDYTGTGGAGGTGGGGAGGSNTTGTAGTANTGGGGGGSGSAAGSGAAGGSGIVIISYAGSTQQMAGGTVTISGGNVIHTFTSSGYLTPLKLVNNSLRFRNSASAYLSRTPTTAGNRKTWTWSGWVKRGRLGVKQYLFQVGTTISTSGYINLFFTASDTLLVEPGGGSWLATSSVYRDPAAWYHVVLACDTTQATDTNRLKLYVNGTQVTALSIASYPAQNLDTSVNNTVIHDIGAEAYNGPANYFDGYMTEVQLIDGQALTPNSFGTFNSYGVWQPITYGGSYGTNGFYLPFISNSSTYAGGFNGSSQQLVTSTSASLALGTSDFTVEYWVCFNATTGGQVPVAAGNGTFGYDPLFGYYDTGNQFVLYLSSNGTTWGISSGNLIGTISPFQWHHVAITRSGNTFYTFLNGVQGSTFTSSSSIYQSANSFAMGRAAGNYANCSLSNVRVVVGTAVYTSNFTIPTSNLTAITNTKLLTLQNATIVDNSTNALTFTNTGSVTTGQTYPFSAAKIFNDQSPAGNNWTPNNISGNSGSTLDTMTDVPTLTSATVANYCVLNPLTCGSMTTLSNGNLKAYGNTASNNGNTRSTIYFTTGKWYIEMTAGATATGAYPSSGIIPSSNATTPDNGGTNQVGYPSNSVAYENNGNKRVANSTSAYGSTYTTGDVIGIAIDADNGAIYFSKNGTFQNSGVPTSGASKTGSAFNWTGGSIEYVFATAQYNGSDASFNFGQQPLVYTPPTGFVALNTFNL